MVLLYQEVMINLLKYGKIKNNNNYLIIEVKYLIIFFFLFNIIKFKNYFLNLITNGQNNKSTRS